MFITRHVVSFLCLAAVITVLALGTLTFFGLPLGVDFTGGALMEASYGERPVRTVIEERLAPLELGGYSLREATTDAGRDAYILRTRDLAESERQAVAAALTTDADAAAIDRYTSIGPTIGAELREKAGWAIGLVALIIVLYVALVFRGVARPVRSSVYGLITVLVLAHDVLVPTALVALLGHVAGAEVDVLFVMAILAVLGYSVNDTIVVFDRVRENLAENHKHDHHEPFDQTVGRALEATFTRSVNTSLTTLLALLALFFIGGDATRTFALVLITGVIAGTYSSLFVAPPLLVAIARWQERRKV